MRDKKGVSMISLVIAIVVTVILIGIVTTAGYKYIIEGNKTKEEAVVSVISEAAYRRQNDLSSGITEAYYEGYKFDVYDNKSKYGKIVGLPEEYASGDSQVPDCLEEPGANWYLFDADSASALGVQEAERFITQNISYPAGLKEDEVKLVLADYASGKGYFVKFSKNIIKDSVKQDTGCLNSPTGNHNYKIIATCTKPAICIYCGEADPNNLALGHDFAPPTCTASGVCRRCGTVDPDNGPLGHLMIANADMSNTELVKEISARDCKIYVNKTGGASSDSSVTPAWITDALKHWHECIRCGERMEEQEHRKGNRPVNSEYHYMLCSECGWESIKSKHECTYESLTDNTHLRECKVCLYEEIHNDTGWRAGHSEYHYRVCNEVSKCYNETLTVNGTSVQILFKEAHYDLNRDLYCDVCGHCLDKEEPKPFEPSSEHYAKTVGATTNTITVEAFTVDNGVGVDYYQFGILNTITGQIDWGEKVYPSDVNHPVQKKFENLKSNTEYVIYVKAVDKAGNFTTPYIIPDTRTTGFPEFKGLTNIPNQYVQGPIYAGIAPIDTELTDLIIKYSLDEGRTWSNISIADINTATIKLTKEIEKVQIKLADSTGNEARLWEYVIEKIDSTPPTITLEAKSGDNNEETALYHTAKVTLSDAKAGLAPDTEVKYAWSTSKTVAPTDFKTLYTKNLENASSLSFELTTPNAINGNYYLWILEGVKDSVGNATTKAVCSNIYFSVDDIEVSITNIKMQDLAPVVANEYLFVKTNGVVTISFEADKKLGEDAVVTLNNKEVNVQTTDGKKYIGAVEITDDFEEGTLQLKITNIVSETGKVNEKTYTNDDLTEGPVIYDKTVPVLEYISKK